MFSTYLWLETFLLFFEEGEINEKEDIEKIDRIFNETKIPILQKVSTGRMFLMIKSYLKQTEKIFRNNPNLYKEFINIFEERLSSYGY